MFVATRQIFHAYTRRTNSSTYQRWFWLENEITETENQWKIDEYLHLFQMDQILINLLWHCPRKFLNFCYIKNYTYINEGGMRQPGYQLLTAAGTVWGVG